MQRIAVNIVLFSVATLLMFRPVGAKFPLNSTLLRGKCAKILSRGDVGMDCLAVSYFAATADEKCYGSLFQLASLCFDYVELTTLEGR